MLESILAVLFISFLFFTLFHLAYLLEVKILLDHAAARAARARAVGFNDFMCDKVARVAIIPVAGERLWPLVGEAAESDGTELDSDILDHRIPLYLAAPDSARAAGLLDYERWSDLKVMPDTETKTRLTFRLFDIESTLEGEAKVEQHYPDYL